MSQDSVTINLEGSDVKPLECRGRKKHLCDGCKLRFMCLSERNEITIPRKIVRRYKIKDTVTLANYVFGEGKVSYEVAGHTSFSETRQVVRARINERQ